ncbi:helix-turn-helix domain-containing protein [Aerococcaceae bacterium DSM 111020]|nr:helix-turn-helix domain-containing protein [Aerococcaceae bacterium DSM 111020]
MFTMKKAHQRQLDIIELLYHNQGWHHFNDIAEAVDASVYSIRDDLSTIGSIFEDYVLLSENKQTVHADFRKDANLETFRRYYLKETISLQFLETLFFNPYLELEEIAEIILTSRSTVYRFIPELNERLSKEFALNLTTKPLKITGDERSIRDFFTIFFNMRYHPLEWPFDGINQTLIDNTIQLIADILQLTLSPPMHRQLSLMTAIGLVRNKKHQYLSQQYLTKDISTSIARIQPYFSSSTVNQQLNELLDQPLETSLLYDIFYPILLLATENSPKMPTDSSLMINHLLSFSEIMELTLNPANARNLAFGINAIISHDTLALIHQSSKITRASHFNTMIQKKQPKLFNRLTQFFKDIASSKNQDFSENTLNQLILYTVTHWDNLFQQLQNDSTPIPILVISDISEGHAQLISDDLKGYFNEAIAVSTGKEGTYQEALSLSPRPKIIVSTFDIDPISDTYIINADPLPDELTYAEVQHALNIIERTE